MRKRLLSILLLCCMVLTLLPTAAVAKANYTGAAATAAVTNDAHRWDTKIEITNVTDGQEYAITTGNTAPTEGWQDSGVFTGLKKNTAYTVYTRVKATPTMAASDSVTTSVKTKNSMYPLAFDLSGLTSTYHYNGSAQDPSVDYASGYSAATVGGFTFKYEKNVSGYPPVSECKLPGAYGVTIVTDNTGSDYASGESYVGVFSISRGNLTAADFQVTGLTTYDYDGSPKKATVTLKSGMEGVGTITVYYEGVAPTVYIRQTTAPTNAGSYKVSVDVATGDYYNGINNLVLGTLTIKKVNYTGTPFTGTVNINGVPKFDETLTANVTDSNNTGTLTYQWYRAGKTAHIGTGETYTLVQADISKEITCRVSSSTETGTIETTVGPVQKADGPAAPVISLRTRTDTRILVTENSAWEYSIDNGANWQGSCLFKDLSPGTKYTIIARVKETATHKPSGNSAPLNVTTIHLTISDELRDKLRAVASAYKGEYDGKEHEAVIVDMSKMPESWTIAGYTTDQGKSFGNSIPKIKDAGTLNVGVKFVHPDYMMNITHYYTAEVTPKPLTTITEDDLEGLNIPANLVTVKCKTTDDSKAYGKIPGGFNLSSATPYMENGVLKAIVKLNLPAYLEKYDADTKKTHEYAGGEGNPHAAFTLKYVNDKWELDGNFPNVVILVKCDGQHPQTPPYPTEENVSGLEQVQVRVQCSTDTAQFKNYGILPGSVSIMPDPNNPSQATLTLIPSVYSTQYSTDTGITHIVDPNQTADNLKIQMRYNSAVGKWMPAGELTPLVINVKCNNHDPQTPPYPTEENVGGLEQVQVRVQCSTDRTQFKNYGILPGGVSIMPDANNPSQATLTLIPSVYSKQYTIDTGITHSVAPNQNTDNLKIQMRYNSAVGKWMPAGELTPLEVLVQCNNHQGQRYTITFNGNGGTLSVTSMTTIDQKLPELPTATHSGRYSFDGWYTAASGGTKITTATVFYENTTVYAHWTYIGGGGSSGGGGGYTYHTIRAISGLNGSISPSGWTSVRHGWDQTFTITPDKGYAVAKVLVDGKSVGSVKSYTFKNVTKDHTIEVVFMKANGNPQTGVFVDVAEGSYYEEAVDWAVENGITTGTGNNYFTPDGICTRAQAVTFLWRVAGSPTPKTEAMPFEDVLNGSYYYEAVLWAVENGITVGTSATTFSPELTCSRAHIVTFLWRAANSPSAKTANPFTDVAADAYYIDAVLWAVKHKITVGTTLSTFSPDEGCTRAQIVTFLYRAHSK